MEILSRQRKEEEEEDRGGEGVVKNGGGGDGCNEHGYMHIVTHFLNGYMFALLRPAGG